MADTLMAGDTNDELFLVSGQFTSTVKQTEPVGSIDTALEGIDYDGTNTQWCGRGGDALYLQSGLFTSTLKTSQTVLTPSGGRISGISSTENPSTPWASDQSADSKLFFWSGQYTTTEIDSFQVQAIDTQCEGVSYDGTNSPWIGNQAERLYLQSGQFSGTILASLTSENSSQDVDFDGTNTPYSAVADARLFLWSGQFTSTELDSIDVANSLGDSIPTGIANDDFNSRAGISVARRLMVVD